MQPTLPCLAAVALCAVVPAQSVTSPLGLDQTEGTTSTNTLFWLPRRFQQVDSTLAGTGARVMSSISFRRDGDRSEPLAGARTMTVEVSMGHGSPGASVTGVFNANYATPPTVVHTLKSVSFPDWTASAAGPAPFDFTLTFDTPFFYNGIDPLVWELQIATTSSFGTVWTDAELDQRTFGYDVADVRDPGCTVVGETEPFRCAAVAFNYGPNHPLLGQRIILNASGAPADTQVIVRLAFPTPATAFPGLLCAPFMLDFITDLAMGESGPSGYTTDLTVDVPYNPQLDGAQIACQAMSLDIAQPTLIPVVLSDVRVFELPAPVELLDCDYVWAPFGSASGTVFPNRGVTALFQ